MKMFIGEGILGWEGGERRSNRYGTIMLGETPFEGSDRAQCRVDKAAIDALAGYRVRLKVKVKATRTSGHLGDLALRIKPVTPAVGAELDLGVGIFFSQPGYDGSPEIGLRPDDGRSVFWFDPRQLYQLHDQTVEIYAEETQDPFSPAPDLSVPEAGAYDTGDGGYQLPGAALLKGMLRATECNLATLDELLGRKSSSTRARKRQFSICSDMLVTCSSMRESIEWVQGCRHLYSRVEEIFGKGEPSVGLDGAFQRWFKARYGVTEP